jgi:acyl carrier protein
LGEIESCLLHIRGVKEAVVVVREEEQGDKNICAYFVSDKEYEISELREYLSKELPDYMIPSYFVRMEKITLTSNGKIDRRSLPKPKVKVGKDYVAPESEVERKIAEIWKEVLGLDDVGIFDNFFELGGNSLKIVIINKRIKTAFEKDIPIVKMFSYPTIHSLANYLGHQEEHDTRSSEKISESVSILKESILMLAD